MNRTVTVKGTGKLNIVPDQINISMSLKAKDMEYEKTMLLAAEQLNQLRTALVEVGFSKEDLKTTCFDVSPIFESIRDKKGNYNRIFVGYACGHRLRVEFVKDMDRLSKTLFAVSHCLGEPEFSIQFTVKDRDAVSHALLESAVNSAKEKAKTLSKAAGVTLGEIISIDYNWGELQLFSPTQYDMEECCCAAPNSARIDIEPDDIDVSDTVTLVWEIK